MTPGVRLMPAAAACALLVLLASHPAARERAAVRAYLSQTFDLTPGELDRVDQGGVVVRSMKGRDAREIATLGVTRISVTPEYYLSGFDDIASFKRDPDILQIGTFGSPPVLEDVAGLSLDEADLRSLRTCRVGSCGLQLSADAIRRFREEIDWSRSDAHARADALMRRILVEYVTGYLERGAAALMEYADEREPLSLQRESVALAAPADRGWPLPPALRRHLVESSSFDARGTTDFLYWSKEKIGHKGVASVTHVAITQGGDAPPLAYAVASRQIYGAHYFDASLGLTLLLRDTTDSAPATYVAYVNRSRIDVFDGLFGGIVRKIVSGRARGTVAEQLARVRRTLERESAAPVTMRRHRAGAAGPRHH